MKTFKLEVTAQVNDEEISDLGNMVTVQTRIARAIKNIDPKIAVFSVEKIEFHAE